MTRSKHNAHTSGLFKSLNLLKYSDLCALHDFKFCYRAENSNLPVYFLNLIQSLRVKNKIYPTRQHFTFQAPLIKHEFARQSICFHYPLIFNNMSLIIREKIYTHSPEGYKNYIKKTNDPIIFR